MLRVGAKRRLNDKGEQRRKFQLELGRRVPWFPSKQDALDGYERILEVWQVTTRQFRRLKIELLGPFRHAEQLAADIL